MQQDESKRGGVAVFLAGAGCAVAGVVLLVGVAAGAYWTGWLQGTGATGPHDAVPRLAEPAPVAPARILHSRKVETKVCFDQRVITWYVYDRDPEAKTNFAVGRSGMGPFKAGSDTKPSEAALLGFVADWGDGMLMWWKRDRFSSLDQAIAKTRDAMSACELWGYYDGYTKRTGSRKVLVVRDPRASALGIHPGDPFSQLKAKEPGLSLQEDLISSEYHAGPVDGLRFRVDASKSTVVEISVEL